MYCKCDKPQPVKVFMVADNFETCSKRLGGCGKEIGGPPDVPKECPVKMTYDKQGYRTYTNDFVDEWSSYDNDWKL